jgi:hypothetical protein
VLLRRWVAVPSWYDRCCASKRVGVLMMCSVSLASFKVTLELDARQVSAPPRHAHCTGNNLVLELFHRTRSHTRCQTPYYISHGAVNCKALEIEQHLYGCPPFCAFAQAPSSCPYHPGTANQNAQTPHIAGALAELRMDQLQPLQARPSPNRDGAEVQAAPAPRHRRISVKCRWRGAPYVHIPLHGCRTIIHNMTPVRKDKATSACRRAARTSETGCTGHQPATTGHQPALPEGRSGRSTTAACMHSCSLCHTAVQHRHAHACMHSGHRCSTEGAARVACGTHGTQGRASGPLGGGRCCATRDTCARRRGMQASSAAASGPASSPTSCSDQLASPPRAPHRCTELRREPRRESGHVRKAISLHACGAA